MGKDIGDLIGDLYKPIHKLEALSGIFSCPRIDDEVSYNSAESNGISYILEDIAEELKNWIVLADQATDIQK
jgi:hypothetical protein